MKTKTDPKPEYLTRKQLSVYSSIAYDTLSNTWGELIADGLIARKIGRVWFVKKTDFDKFMDTKIVR